MFRAFHTALRISPKTIGLSVRSGLVLFGSRAALVEPANRNSLGNPVDIQFTRPITKNGSWVDSWQLALTNWQASLLTLLRALNLLRICFPLIILSPIAYYREGYRYTWFRRLVRTLEQCGPIFIKLGQWAATRRDLFPLSLCQELSVLHRSTQTHTWLETKDILESNLEQVHKAKLKSNDTMVAVKVLHPNIRHLFQQDLKVMQAIAKSVLWMAPNLKWLSPDESLREFAKLMDCQLNLKIEAQNLELLSRNFKSTSNVIFPKPVHHLCSEYVLVETFEEGIHIGDFIKDVVNEQDRPLMKKVANIGVHMLLKMIFQDNLVHGDLHPGNILVRNEDPPRIVILDPGIVSSLSTHDMGNFKSVFKAVISGDGSRVGHLFLERSFNQCQSPEKFVKEMESIVLEARSQQLSLNRLDVSKLLTKVFNTLLVHEVKLESNFASVILAILVLEGLGRTLDPDLDLVIKATPYVMRS
eukprot:TCALIF_11325-PA protein Name:"Similar to Adck2 Uncharacterized aarF domain-containing protein kinase 2 (Mus musculus)" AED:0.03 eAED:0.03 QI:1346/0.66/0.75/1/0.66/0.75/4/7/471